MIIVEYTIFQNYYIFLYFLKYIGNDIKIDVWSSFQTSSCVVKPKQKSLEY